MSNNLKREKDFVESFNKPSEAIKYFEQLMRSPRSISDTSRSEYTSTEEGESSKSGQERSNKGKSSKPTFHNFDKIGHNANVYRSKTTN